MPASDGSLSFYFFDIDNLLFLPTRLYLWNAETRHDLHYLQIVLRSDL
jgi:hypothetical protein